MACWSWDWCCSCQQGWCRWQPAGGGMSPEKTPILKVSKLVKRFGGFHALDGLSFHVVPGEILGLVGPNGSGKTTAINVISGLYAPDGGEVVFDNVSSGGVASHKLVHRGINRTFQVPKPFLSLTVRENIQVALAYGGATGAPAIGQRHLDVLAYRERQERLRHLKGAVDAAVDQLVRGDAAG